MSIKFTDFFDPEARSEYMHANLDISISLSKKLSSSEKHLKDGFSSCSLKKALNSIALRKRLGAYL